MENGSKSTLARSCQEISFGFISAMWSLPTVSSSRATTSASTNLGLRENPCRHQEMRWGRILGFHRKTGRDDRGSQCDRWQYIFWAHDEISGWRRKHLALPESRDEDRQLSHSSRTGVGGDTGGEPSLRHARPLRPSSVVKA